MIPHSGWWPGSPHSIENLGNLATQFHRHPVLRPALDARGKNLMRKTPLARRGVLTVTILALSAVAAACSASPGSPSSGASGGSVTTHASTATTGPAQPGTQVSGTLSDGTSWVAEYPAPWNGTLVLYSHGFGALTAFKMAIIFSSLKRSR